MVSLFKLTKYFYRYWNNLRSFAKSPFSVLFSVSVLMLFCMFSASKASLKQEVVKKFQNSAKSRSLHLSEKLLRRLRVWPITNVAFSKPLSLEKKGNGWIVFFFFFKIPLKQNCIRYEKKEEEVQLLDSYFYGFKRQNRFSITENFSDWQ